MKTGIFEFPERKIVRELNMSNNCIDVISIVSAFWVMLAHYSNYLFDTSDWLVRIPSPYFAVVFFFFISGFLCYGSMQRSTSWYSFLCRRIIRIYKPLIVVLLFPLLFWFCVGRVEMPFVDLVKYSLKSLLVLNSGYFPNGTFENGSLWTIPIQIQFYLLTPLVVSFLNRTNILLDSLLFVLLLLVSFAFPYINGLFPEQVQGVIVRLCLPHLYIYVFGLLMGKYFMILRLNWLYMAMFAVLTVLFNVYDYIVFSTLSFCLLVLFVSYSFGKCRLKYEFSYSLYLWHMAIFSFVSSFNYFSAISIFLLASCCSIIISFISFLLFEQK